MTDSPKSFTPNYFVQLGKLHPGIHQANPLYWATPSMIEMYQWLDGLDWYERQQRKEKAA